MYRIQQSSTAYKLMFLMVSSTDHVSPLTGATVTVTLSKNGAAFGSPSGAVSELANGVYLVAGNATDTNTLGPLWLHATATGGDPTDVCYDVVIEDLTTKTIANVTTVTTVTNQLTAAQIATGIWQDLTSGSDFSTSGSIGALLKLNIDAAISSRMATYTQPTGFLAATFPSGTVANTTNITTVGAVSGNVAGSVASVVGLTASNLDTTVSSRLAAASYTAPPTATANADALLDRDMSVGTDSGSPTVRTPRQALRALRNKVDTSTTPAVIYKENDTTPSWSTTLTTDPTAEPVVTSDPA